MCSRPFANVPMNQFEHSTMKAQVGLNLVKHFTHYSSSQIASRKNYDSALFNESKHERGTFPAHGPFSDLSRYSEGETVKAAWMWVSFEAGLADSIQIPHGPAAFISWNLSCL